MAKLNGIMTNSIEPLPRPEGAGLTAKMLTDIHKQLQDTLGISSHLLMPEPAWWARRQVFDRMMDRFAPVAGHYFGLKFRVLPEHLFRQPDPPPRSRPRRVFVRAARKRVRAARPKLRPMTKAYHCKVFKLRKVRDRRGFAPNSIFMINPHAV